MEITRQQAKLFLQLLEAPESIPKEDNILRQTFGNIECSVLDTYVLKKKLKEFIYEE